MTSSLAKLNYRSQEYVVQHFWKRVFENPTSAAAYVKNLGPGTQRVAGAMNQRGPMMVYDVPPHPFNRINYHQCGHLVAIAVDCLGKAGISSNSYVAVTQSDSFECFVATMAAHSLGATVVSLSPRGYYRPLPQRVRAAMERCPVLLGENRDDIDNVKGYFEGSMPFRHITFKQLLIGAPDYTGSRLPRPPLDAPAPRPRWEFDAVAVLSVARMHFHWQRAAAPEEMRLTRQPFAFITPDQPAVVMASSIPSDIVNTPLELSFGDQADGAMRCAVDTPTWDRGSHRCAIAGIQNKTWSGIIAQSACIWNGVPLVFADETEREQAMKTEGPTIAIGVPAHWEKVAVEMQQRLSSKWRVRSNLLRLAKKLGQRRLQVWLEEALGSDWAREQFGSELRIIFTGGVPPTAAAADFFKSIGVDIYHDYGHFAG